MGGWRVTAVMTFTGDIGARYEEAIGKKKKKIQVILLLGGFHGNASHHNAPRADDPSAEQKHLESLGDKT